MDTCTFTFLDPTHCFMGLRPGLGRQGSGDLFLNVPVYFCPQLEFPGCWSVGCGPLHVCPCLRFFHWGLVGDKQAGWKHLQTLWSHYPLSAWISAAFGVKPAGWSMSERHVETAINSFSDWTCRPFLRLTVLGIDRVSPDQVALDCCMSAVELAFHFYVAPRWLLGRK